MAHEFVAVPTLAHVATGAPLAVEVYSTHSVLNAEELEATEINRVRFVHGTTRNRGDLAR